LETTVKYLIVFVLLLVSGCDGESTVTKKVSLPLISDVSESTWEKLSQKTIYFGHQSVGNNLLQGIEELKEIYPSLNINIVKFDNSIQVEVPQIIHSLIGENEKPGSKNIDVEELLTGRLRNSVDVAFFKYCYIDFGSDTDSNKIFKEYKNTINKIKNSNPEMVIVHFTVPLTEIQEGVKGTIKKLLGKPVGGVMENVKRNDYNQMIIDEYGKDGLVFDLANYEATKSDGSLNLFEYKGKKYKYLAHAYSSDGGHLNEVGRKFIAERFLLFLAQNIH